MEDIRQRSSIGSIFMPIITFLIFYSHNFNNRHPELLYFFVGPITILCIIRLIHYFIYKKIDFHFPVSNSIVFILEILLTAFLWGLWFLAIMMMKNEHETHIIITITAAGLCAGGVLAYIPNLLLSVSFNILLTWQTSIYLLFTSNNIMGIFFILFSFYLFFIAYRGNQEYWAGIRNEIVLANQAAELEIISHIDVLTGIFNRRYFDDRFEQEWNRSVRDFKPISMIICDLDNFKHLNDQYGHLAGDEIIKHTAKNLKSVFKRTTDIVCRYGGEEFVVLLLSDADEATALANETRKLQEETLTPYKDKTLRATISIGVASIIPTPSTDRNQLLAEADSALYRAKRSGKNLVISSEPS